MATFSDTIIQLKSSNIDLNDKIYLSKSEDNVAYSLSMDELIKKIQTTVSDLNNYTYYTGSTQNLQRKFGFSDTDTSQEFWDALAHNVMYGNHSRIQYGDIVYMPITWNGATVNLWQVVDIDKYGDHNLIFRPYNSIPFSTYRHNTTDVNRIGWSGSLIRSIFNGYSTVNAVAKNSSEKYNSGCLNQLINTACGGHLRKIKRNLASYNTSTNSWGLSEITDYAFLPTGKELTGRSDYQYSGESGEQFKLFQLGHNGFYNSNYSYTWTCSPDADYSRYFVFVNDYGYLSLNNALDNNYVCPCWCFGIGN